MLQIKQLVDKGSSRVREGGGGRLREKCQPDGSLGSQTYNLKCG